MTLAESTIRGTSCTFFFFFSSVQCTSIDPRVPSPSCVVRVGVDRVCICRVFSGADFEGDGVVECSHSCSDQKPRYFERCSGRTLVVRSHPLFLCLFPSSFAPLPILMLCVSASLFALFRFFQCLVCVCVLSIRRRRLCQIPPNVNERTARTGNRLRLGQCSCSGCSVWTFGCRLDHSQGDDRPSRGRVPPGDQAGSKRIVRNERVLHTHMRVINNVKR